MRDCSDYLMLMAYDEHWATGQPGSIASQDWFEQTLANRMRNSTPRKPSSASEITDTTGRTAKEADRRFVSGSDAFGARFRSAGSISTRTPKNHIFTYDEDDGASHGLVSRRGHGVQRNESRGEISGRSVSPSGGWDRKTPRSWDVFGGDLPH